MTSSNRPADPQRSGWNVKFRRSSLAPPTPAQLAAQATADQAKLSERAKQAAAAQTRAIAAQGQQASQQTQYAPQSLAESANRLREPSRRLPVRRPAIRQTAYAAQPQDGFAIPNVGGPADAPLNAPALPPNPALDNMDNLFGSQLNAVPESPAPEQLQPGIVAPADSDNVLRGNGFDSPAGGQDDSLADQLRNSVPELDSNNDLRMAPQTAPAELPRLQSDIVESPSDASGSDAEPNPFGEISDSNLAARSGLSCEDFRDRIAVRTIDKVSLDISPPFRPDILMQAEYEEKKAVFDSRQPSREWRSIDGRLLAEGRLTDLAYEQAVIETEHGTIDQVQINRLSEADLEYISSNWGLPTECLIEQVAFTPRNWTPTTMTWKASNLCHKPLYFEEVNLERYGHTAGPVLQPLVSSAHFFGNIIVLPYKMGVHGPTECQYSLGYYRPGNCAPWIVPPVPISLRGGLYQAAAVTGAFWLIP